MVTKLDVRIAMARIAMIRRLSRMSYTAKMALSVAEVYTRRADELHESALHDEVENDADGIAYYQRSAIICLLSILVGEIDEVSRLHDH